jgi:hypothetical protein
VILQDQRRRGGMGSVVPEPRRVEEGIVAEIRISMIFQSTVKRLTPFGADIL